MRARILSAALLVVIAASVGSAANLIPFGSNWTYLSPLTLEDDPNIANPNFASTWFQPNFSTDGWSGPSPGPFARSQDGVDPRIDAFKSTSSRFIRPPGTLLEQPATGNRGTSYFRTEFTTSAPLTDLALEFIADDGVTFYLNGEELVRHNCCFDDDGVILGNDVTPSHLNLALGAGNERTYTLLPILVGSELPAGTHTLAASVHNRTLRDSDQGFSARVIDGYGYRPFIEPEETWDYMVGFDEPSDGTLDWTTVDFDLNRDWERGRTGIGFELGTDDNASVQELLNTELIDMQGNYSTIYMRKKFTVDNVEELTELSFTADHDDGIVVYINGQEVTRNSVPGDVGVPLAFDALATSHESTNNNTNPAQLFRTTIDLAEFPGLLNQGNDNVLAIHGLNTTIGSTDFVVAQLNLAGISFFEEPTPSGDYDGNGLLEASDIDTLAAAIRSGNQGAEFDLNGDGTVNGDDHSFWVNDLKNTWFGDANLDGQFTTADFVVVFGAGQFEDSTPGNSTWATGDWNGDSDFTTADFVAAFGAAGFEVGPKPGGVNPGAVVPEPTSAFGTLIMVALMAVYRRKQR